MLRTVKSIIGDIRRWFSAMNTKRIVIIVLSAVFIITPTVLAVGYVIENEFIKEENLFSVALYNEKDELLLLSNGGNDESASVADLFIHLTENPTPPSFDISELKSGRYIKAVITQNGVSSELTCYFSTDREVGFYTDAKGQAFVIPPELNSSFLETRYAELFYLSAQCHTLTTIDGDTILPKEAEWFYQITSGEYMQATNNKVSAEQRKYEITGALDMHFDSAPDSCTITVYQGERCIYIGGDRELASLTVDSGEELRVTVDAQWKKTRGVSKYGRLSYDFLVHIKNRSAFSVNKDTVYSGGFIVLDCTNITDISKIKFTSDKDGIFPVFRRYNGAVRTVIPFPESEAADTFNFTVTYGASSQSFSINILPARNGDEYSYQSQLFDSEDTPQALTESIEDVLLNTNLAQNDLIYFRGNFYNPTQNGYTHAYTHNSLVMWGEELQYSYTAIGNEYISTAAVPYGASVASVQNGVVALAGSNRELGNFIIIDHGCGLRTWYTHLGSFDIKIGDIVLAGQHIGKAGIGTIDGKEGFRLFCTVDNILIDPNNLW